jgi:tungstate transport system substrate-binding protein
MATTTSTENSGLLKYLLPQFEAEHKVKVQVIAVGTGKALELGKNGDVDVVLVHAREAEDQFVAAGFGVNRRDVMYNDFVIVGPSHDPAGLKHEKDLMAALAHIVEKKAKFVSRGDASGTEIMEQKLWRSLGQKPKGSDYLSAGLGMGEVLNMASELQAYTLSDRATFAAYQAKTGLQIVSQGDARLKNPYGIIAVNPKRFPELNTRAATIFIDWMVSEKTKQRIANFTIHGEQVFFTDNKPTP